MKVDSHDGRHLVISGLAVRCPHRAAFSPHGFLVLDTFDHQSNKVHSTLFQRRLDTANNPGIRLAAQHKVRGRARRGSHQAAAGKLLLAASHSSKLSRLSASASWDSMGPMHSAPSLQALPAHQHAAARVWPCSPWRIAASCIPRPGRDRVGV